MVATKDYFHFLSLQIAFTGPANLSNYTDSSFTMINNKEKQQEAQTSRRLTVFLLKKN